MSKGKEAEVANYIKMIDGVPHMKVEITAKNAMFSNPLFTEKISYDVITPQPVKSIIGCVYWHPGCRIILDKIHVMNPIRKESMKVNFVPDKIKPDDCLKKFNKGEYPSAEIKNNMQITMQRLVDVRYIVEFQIEMGEDANEGDSPLKFASILARRLISGEQYYSPYAGMNRFPCDVVGLKADYVIPKAQGGTRDLGLMFYGWDMSGKKRRPIMYNPVMIDGIIDMTNVQLYVPFTEGA